VGPPQLADGQEPLLVAGVPELGGTQPAAAPPVKVPLSFS